MKVALWNTSYFEGVGGAEKAVNELLNEFSRRGLDVCLIAKKVKQKQTNNEFLEPLAPNIKVYQDAFEAPLDDIRQPLIFILKLLKYFKATIGLFRFLL